MCSISFFVIILSGIDLISQQLSLSQSSHVWFQGNQSSPVVLFKGIETVIFYDLHHNQVSEWHWTCNRRSAQLKPADNLTETFCQLIFLVSAIMSSCATNPIELFFTISVFDSIMISTMFTATTSIVKNGNDIRYNSSNNISGCVTWVPPWL